MNKKKDNLEEDEVIELEKLKEMALIFQDLQHDVILEKYKIFSEEVKSVIIEFFAKNEETLDSDVEFTDLLRFALDKIQTLIRYITVSTKITTGGGGKKEPHKIDITNAFNEKIEKAKV
jgi:hypothetical protein